MGKENKLRVFLVAESGENAKTAYAVVPYVKGSTVTLPDEYPFNKNVILGGDTGYSLRELRITESGAVEYFYNGIYEIANGKATAEKRIGNENFVVVFTLVEE